MIIGWASIKAAELDQKTPKVILAHTAKERLDRIKMIPAKIPL